jgi:hypothetical protein
MSLAFHFLQRVSDGNVNCAIERRVTFVFLRNWHQSNKNFNLCRIFLKLFELHFCKLPHMHYDAYIPLLWYKFNYLSNKNLIIRTSYYLSISLCKFLYTNIEEKKLRFWGISFNFYFYNFIFFLIFVGFMLAIYVSMSIFYFFCSFLFIFYLIFYWN